MSLKVKIKYLNENLVKLEKISIGDWIDLRASEEVALKQGQFYQIPLGVAMELPKGYEAWLTSRSSLNKNFGVIHCDDLGVIDQSYCGDDDEWLLPVIATRDTVIHVNDRICQFRVSESMPEIELEEVKTLGNPNRGGTGSTGKN